MGKFPRASHEFHREREALAAADADGRETAAEPALAQRREERDDDARTACADGMAERDRAAANVELVVRHAELAHERQRHDGKSFVHLPEVDLADVPTSAL